MVPLFFDGILFSAYFISFLDRLNLFLNESHSTQCYIFIVIFFFTNDMIWWHDFLCCISSRVKVFLHRESGVRKKKFRLLWRCIVLSGWKCFFRNRNNFQTFESMQILRFPTWTKTMLEFPFGRIHLYLHSKESKIYGAFHFFRFGRFAFLVLLKQLAVGNGA